MTTTTTRPVRIPKATGKIGISSNFADMTLSSVFPGADVVLEVELSVVFKEELVEMTLTVILDGEVELVDWLRLRAVRFGGGGLILRAGAGGGEFTFNDGPVFVEGAGAGAVLEDGNENVGCDILSSPNIN